MLTMRPMCLEEADAAYDCMQDLPSENGFGNGGYGLSYEEFVNGFIPHCDRYAKGIDRSRDMCPKAITSFLRMKGRWVCSSSVPS